MNRTRWPYPRFAAHRGAGKRAPENTLAALKLGHSFGYRMAEFDVKLSADGVAFLLHDSTLQRTTNGYGRADARIWRVSSAPCETVGTPRDLPVGLAPAPGTPARKGGHKYGPCSHRCQDRIYKILCRVFRAGARCGQLAQTAGCSSG